MMITKIDKAACRFIAAEARKVLEAVAAESGLTVKVGGGRYDPATGTFSPKVEFSVEGADRRAFDLDAPLVGLEPADFGRSFTVRGRTFTVKGINPRASRFPIIATAEDGAGFKFSESVVKAALAQEVLT